MHETEHTQKLHHAFVLLDLFCGLRSSLDAAVHLHGCLYINVVELSMNVTEVALPWPLIGIMFNIFSVTLQAT